MKPIPNCDGYYADEAGVIYTTKRKGGNARAAGQRGSPQPLAIQAGTNGYSIVSLNIGGQVVTRQVHRLILETFVGPRPSGLEACHYPDHDKSNNRLSNLRWDTHTENILDDLRDSLHLPDKECRTCHVIKTKMEFYADSRSQDGLKSQCMTCHCQTSVASRDPDKKRAANREYMRRKRAAERATM